MVFLSYHKCTVKTITQPCDYLRLYHVLPHSLNCACLGHLKTIRSSQCVACAPSPTHTLLIHHLSLPPLRLRDIGLAVFVQKPLMLKDIFPAPRLCVRPYCVKQMQRHESDEIQRRVASPTCVCSPR